MSSSVGTRAGGFASSKEPSASGATLVKRHASCFMFGKPRLSKRAIAPLLISFSHSGARAAPFPAQAL